jgi:hypothetical protein
MQKRGKLRAWQTPDAVKECHSPKTARNVSDDRNSKNRKITTPYLQRG